MPFKDKKQTISYNNEYNKGAYDRISLMLPKGKKEEIEKVAGKRQVNAFIKRAIDLLLEQTEEQK